jgi:glutathione peroxidase-family protein
MITKKSIYDIPMSSWDNIPNFLNKYKGKVSLVVNVTGECGNAPEYGVIESIYKKYKDKGFEVIAIPTNQFCGAGITYNKWEEGLSCATGAVDAKEYAIEEYQVSYNFSELINSKPGLPLNKNLMEKEYPGREQEFPIQLSGAEEPHELYKEISSQIVEINKTLPNNNYGQGEYMYGNFEKYLIDKDGYVVKWYHNGTLMPYAHDKDSFDFLGIKIGTVEEEYEALCQDIQNLLNK